VVLDDKLLTIAEVAPLFRIKPTTLYQSPEWRDRLGFQRFGRKLLAPSSTINRVLSEGWDPKQETTHATQ
jgi:hypothetical protein